MSYEMRILGPRTSLGFIVDPDGAIRMDKCLVRDMLETARPENLCLYLAKPDPQILLDGQADPDSILRLAKAWDKKIVDEAKRLFEKWLASPETNSTLTYEVKKIARRLDDEFAPYQPEKFLDYRAYGQKAFRPLLGKDGLTRIMADPRRYALIAITVDY